jgi:hypothetical protein
MSAPEQVYVGVTTCPGMLAEINVNLWARSWRPMPELAMFGGYQGMIQCPLCGNQHEIAWEDHPTIERVEELIRQPEPVR